MEKRYYEKFNTETRVHLYRNKFGLVYLRYNTVSVDYCWVAGHNMILMIAGYDDQQTVGICFELPLQLVIQNDYQHLRTGAFEAIEYKYKTL